MSEFSRSPLPTPQSELGASHAWSSGGDYSGGYSGHLMHQGVLGLDTIWDSEVRGYRVRNVVCGDTWDLERSGPLGRLGSRLESGDVVLGVNRIRLDPRMTVNRALAHHAGKEVNLTIVRRAHVVRAQQTLAALRNEQLKWVTVASQRLS